MKNLSIAALLILFITLPGSFLLKAQVNNVAALDETIGKPELALKIVRARQYMQSVQMVFELSNQMEWLKHCWIGVSFYDREGEFLYRELPLMYTSLPKGRSQRQEVWLESTDFEDIGTVLLRPMLLETALREMFFDTSLFQIVHDNKYHFRIVFETEE